MTSTITAQSVLAETFHRYRDEWWESPNLMRVTRALHDQLRKEWEPYMVYDPTLPYMPANEFRFMGALCRADLPGNHIAALAVYD